MQDPIDRDERPPSAEVPSPSLSPPPSSSSGQPDKLALEEYRFLIESIPQQVWTALPDGTLDHVSSRCLDYFGRTYEEMIGWGWKDVLHPDDVAPCIERWTRSLLTGDTYEVEFRLRRAEDGAFRWHLGRALPQRDERGRITRWFGTNTDIDDRKRTEEALRASEARFRHLIEAIPVGIVVGDLKTGAQAANDAYLRMLGYSRSEAAQVPWDQLTPPEYRARDEQAREEIRATGTCAQFEKEYMRRDGSRLPVLVGGALLNDESAAVGFAIDMEEHRRMRQEVHAAREAAEAANRSKSEFLANMSHELRTPLNAVIGYSEMLHEEALAREIEDFVPDLERILRSGRSLLALISNILDLSKIEAGKMEVLVERFALPELLAEVAATVAPLVARNQSTLEVVCSAEVGEMETDRVKLCQCLMNLLSNAAKFTQQGRITLEAQREVREGRPWYALTVHDQGIGMDAQAQARIFEPFAQGDPATAKNFGGTGLGLAITRRLCQLVGGDVSVQSEKGVGSTFTIRVPAGLTSA